MSIPSSPRRPLSAPPATPADDHQERPRSTASSSFHGESVGRHIGEIATPALIVDANRIQRNAEAMTARAHLLGVKLRPHLKTCQSLPVANLLLGEDWDTAAAATLMDVRIYFEAGLKNIRYTSPFAPTSVAAVAPLIREGLHFEAIVSDQDLAALLGLEAKRHGVVLNLVIELTVQNGERSGVDHGSEAFIALAKFIDQHPHLALVGIYADASSAAGHEERAKRIAAIEHHRETLAEAQKTLAGIGISVGTVSIGSTPALTEALSLNGVTEACAGLYGFQDLEQHRAGLARLNEIAITVLATVIQHCDKTGRIFIDAGSLTLAQDACDSYPDKEHGFGLVTSVHDASPLGPGDIVVTSFSQEQGVIARRNGEPVPTDELPVGARIRILPNHACVTVAVHRGYHVVSADGTVTDYWPRTGS